MDAAGSRRAIMFGESDGGPLCALFAATYPDHVLGLVMHGPDVRAAWASDAPWGMTSEDFRAEVENIERGWGTGRFERRFLEEIAPSKVGDEDFLNWTTTCGLTFEDAGEHELKGVPDPWHLYRVVG